MAAGAIAVRRCLKEDLRRIAKATGGQLISSLANLEGEESFEASYLGFAEEVIQERVADDEVILVKGTKVVSSASVVLRGANDYMLDEMERALHDTLSIVKRTLESGAVVPGGGAVESALSVYLENFATTLVSFHLFRDCNKYGPFPAGLKRTTCHRRICIVSPFNPQTAGDKRRERFYLAHCQASFVPPRGPECSHRRSEEGVAEVWTRPFHS